ncbi:MAG: CPBP family intramembrane metalloprotease [Gemmatimonadota bacterium]|nr:MAG: CPBP family intramembrane metalloprotease [Gemmatimonadota bacterium]
MKASDEIRRDVLTFLLVLVVLSTGLFVLFFAYGRSIPLVLAMMWSPGIAAILTRIVHRSGVRDFGWGWGATRYQVAACAMPLVLCLVVYGLSWLTGLGGASIADYSTYATEIVYGLGLAGALGFAVALVVQVLYSLPVYSAFILGEEIGWSGLLTPQLARLTSFFKTSLIVGFVWAAWHYPAMIGGFYGPADRSLWFTMPCFTVILVGCSFIRAWLRLKSASLWVGVFLHFSHNLFIQDVFGPITVDRGPTPYIVSEFGVGLAIAYSVAALLLWRRRSELPQASGPAPELSTS